MAAKPVVAGTDGSPESVRAVEWAAREAVLRETSLRIVAVPALPPRMSTNPATRETVAGMIEQAMNRALAAAASDAAEQAPDLAIETQLLAGSPASALVESARDASMLVVGSRGAGGFSAMILGSVSRYAATHAACPVVVVREETMAAHREIVVGVRDPVQSAAALGFAFEEAALRKARLVAVHAVAWSIPAIRPHGEKAGAEAGSGPGETVGDEDARMEALLAVWREKYPDVEARWEVVHAHPGRVLAGASARADLVVLGRHAPGEAHAPGVGSVTHSVLSHAHGPVASVPGE
ncbi:MAG TPA: universal stress protein [Streptosporangiaceae bacterium]|nr:universal stress protein [Streptosporangiaceae bacterium]